MKYEQFIAESKTDLAPEMANEIEELIVKLCDKGANREDTHYITYDTPYEITPGSAHPKHLGIVFYTDLISYSDTEDKNKAVGYVLQPWIACRISLDNVERSHEDVKTILDWVVKKVEEIGLKPFMDEDASYNHWNRKEASDYTEYTMYVNPSYPDGVWENHTIE